MESDQLLASIRKSICEEVDVFQEGIGRFAIDTPFGFDDGDSFVIVLENREDEWYITDEGHTFMHLSYDDSDDLLENGQRFEHFSSVLHTHRMQNNSGELIMRVDDLQFGNALFTFIQALNKITTIVMFKKDTVASMFKEDFKEYMKVFFHGDCEFNYYNKEHDSDGKYVIDCFVGGEKPILVFALSSKYKCQDAIISCMKFKEWNIPFTSIGVFEESEKIGNKIQAQSMDTFDKQFSTLYSAKDGLDYYLNKMAIC